MITTIDKILRELAIVQCIYHSQYKRNNKKDPIPYPSLLDDKGKHIGTGRYLKDFHIFSDVELFSIQQYKKEFTDRFETANNLTLLKNQLTEIHKKAVEARDFYNSHLTDKCKLVKSFLLRTKKLPFDDRIKCFLEHSSVITVRAYQIGEIYLGTDRISVDWIYGNRGEYYFNYLSNNQTLASICQSLIDFIEKFDFLRDMKNFEIERRESFDKPYLKVFLRGGLDHSTVATHLQNLHSISRANVTDQKSGKRDLTIYPAKAYDISEVEQEIELTLKNYFEGSSVDPSFVTETISSISNKAYFQILDYILLLGKNLEAFKQLNTKFDEERYRDYFLAFLNSISKQHAAKGEVFNREGKTDILLFDKEGNNVFIAECKLWKGETYLLNGVEQLFNNYVNWRDEKTAIIIFNRDVKNFTDLTSTATKAVENHSLCLKFVGKRKDTSFSYVFRNPHDEKKQVKLELVLLNFT